MAGLRKRQPKSSAARVRQHRERMRKLGLKPVTLWLPDVNDPAYIAEVRRQCAVVSGSPGEAEHDAWIEAVQADLDLGAPYDWGPDAWGPGGPTPGSLPGAVAPGTKLKRG